MRRSHSIQVRCDCSLVYFLFLGPYPDNIFFFFFIKITTPKRNTTEIGEITNNKTHPGQLFPLHKKKKHTYSIIWGLFQILGLGSGISKFHVGLFIHGYLKSRQKSLKKIFLLLLEMIKHYKQEKFWMNSISPPPAGGQAKLTERKE